MGLLDVHANFPYLAIAETLGLEPVANYSVPVVCPYCGFRSFVIHQDNSNLEELYFCSSCQASGSVIGLACERLDMSERATLKFLAATLSQKITHKSINDYCKACELKNKYVKFWNHAKNRRLNPSQKEQEYLSFLGWNLHNPMSLDRQLESISKLYGLADPVVAEKMLGKHVLKKQPLVVVPFYRVPNVVSSFACFSPKQTIYTNALSHYDNRKGEPGFSGLQFIDRFNSELVVATSLIRVMICLQIRNFSSSNHPLPIVGWHPPTKASVIRQWSVLGDRQIVLWEKEPTAALIHQALIENAKVVFQGPRSESLYSCRDGLNLGWKKWVKHNTPGDIWKKIIRNAKTVEHALRNWSRVATEDQKITLLQNAEQHNRDTADLVRKSIGCKKSKEIGKKIRIGSHKRNKNPGQTSSYSVILEKNNKWYDRQGNLKLSGIVRVHNVIVHPSGLNEYIGTLTTDEKTVEFRVDKADADMSWLKRFAANNGIYLREDFSCEGFNNNNRFRFNPFEAAIAFESPSVLLGKDRIGWNGVSFQFVNAELQNGVFSKHSSVIFPKNSPGPKKSFSALHASVKKTLVRPTKENEITWALALSLCSQITSPVVGLQPYGIVIKKDIEDIFVSTLLCRFRLTKGPYTGWEHNWPRSLPHAGHAAAKDSTGFFVTQSKLKRAPLENTIELALPETDLQPRLITYSADKIITNYLRWFSKHIEKESCWPVWLYTTKEKTIKAFPFVPERLINNAFSRLTIR